MTGAPLLALVVVGLVLLAGLIVGRSAPRVAATPSAVRRLPDFAPGAIVLASPGCPRRGDAIARLRRRGMAVTDVLATERPDLVDRLGAGARVSPAIVFVGAAGRVSGVLSGEVADPALDRELAKWRAVAPPDDVARVPVDRLAA